MVDFRDELRKMQKHREGYYPALTRMAALYRENRDTKQLVQLRDEPLILTILELRDIGYIEPEVLTIEKSFNTIVAVWYNGSYPLTDKGKDFLSEHGGKKVSRDKKIIIAAIIAAAVLVSVYFTVKGL